MKKQTTVISQEEARTLFLQSQGLINPKFGEGKKATLEVIDHLGYIQIDTISVIARAHQHTLWNRVSNYNDNFLNELLSKDKTVFEYWSHAAAYLPMCDYRFSLPRKKLYSEGKSHWFAQDKKMNKYVLDKIKAEGPLQSKDFEHKRNNLAQWYEWKPAKQALEQLFMEGKLMVATRRGFQKVYDLTERVLPSRVDTSFPNEKDYSEHIILKAIQANGLVNEAEISYLRTGLKMQVNKSIKRLLEEEKIKQVIVDGIANTSYYTDEKKFKSLKKAVAKDDIHFLSPFDNSMIQRKRLAHFFDYDYQIECYLPESKRKFGYYCLPILYNTSLVGRLDPKADRASGIFYIKSIHFENKFHPDDSFNSAFANEIKDFALFNGCDEIKIETSNVKWKKEILSLIG